MRYSIVVICLMAMGCGPSCEQVCNQKERQRIFKECLKLVPVGPVITKYNDWDEVVSECGTQAYYQALELKCTGKKNK